MADSLADQSPAESSPILRELLEQGKFGEIKQNLAPELPTSDKNTKNNNTEVSNPDTDPDKEVTFKALSEQNISPKPSPETKPEDEVDEMSLLGAHFKVEPFSGLNF